VSIHPTAIIEEGAVLGAGCVIHPHAIIKRGTVLGDGVAVHPFAVIGGDPNFLKFDPVTVSGVRVGAGTVKGSNDVIKAITKTFASLAGLVFMLLMIAQFIAYFNFSNMPSVIAVTLANWLEQANIGAVPLLIGFIIVIMLLDIIIPGSMPKWAIFAPIFVPLFMRLGTAPQTVLAAYRIGDSPVNTLTPLMVYLPFIVTIAQRYKPDAGIGTIIALMVPYAMWILITWTLLYLAWFLLGIPWGPGAPVHMP